MHWRSCLTARYMSGAAWRRMEEGAMRGGSCSGSPTASGPSRACSGARCLSHFTAQWGLQTWHCYEPRGHPLPCCFSLLSFNPFPCFSQHPSVSFSPAFSPPSLLFTPPPLSLPGASLPSRTGQQTRHRALLCRHSHFDSKRDNMVNH